MPSAGHRDASSKRQKPRRGKIIEPSASALGKGLRKNPSILPKARAQRSGAHCSKLRGREIPIPTLRKNQAPRMRQPGCSRRVEIVYLEHRGAESLEQDSVRPLNGLCEHIVKFIYGGDCCAAERPGTSIVVYLPWSKENPCCTPSTVEMYVPTTSPALLIFPGCEWPPLSGGFKLLNTPAFHMKPRKGSVGKLMYKFQQSHPGC